MYITTFYSYKGGVGRSMALVNIAMSLAHDGKRVLMVDFDLEAPGISTYECLNCTKGQPGVVDYVTDFLRTDIAPDVSEFISKCGDDKYPIWLMPAGDNENSDYSLKLNSIDWQKVYEEHSGFLMIEDLKAQWSQYDGKGFDYVFVDSRTGHTDVGGICTRQIPDAIVFMFFPNEQNIIGLEPIVQSVRNYRDKNHKQTALHFCPSNVPDLDDDENILENILASAQKRLGYDKPSQLIHHYASLDLLQQTVFTTERRNTRLAKQYIQLKKIISSRNYEDREGALYALQEIDKTFPSIMRSEDRKKISDLVDRVENIKNAHSDDAEINWSLARIFSNLRNREEEIDSLSVAIANNYKKEESLLQRSTAYMGLNEVDKARIDLEDIVSSNKVDAFVFVPALQMLSSIDDSWQEKLKDAETFRRFDGRAIYHICKLLMTNRNTLLLALQIADECLDDGRANDHEMYLENQISLCLIGSGEFDQAIELIGESIVENPSDMADIFNYAIASWGLKNSPSISEFERFVELHDQSADGLENANYYQCLAIAYSALKRDHDAVDALSRAMEQLPNHGRIFSCWKYLEESTDTIREELIQMSLMAEKFELLQPALFDETRTLLH